MKKLLVLFVIIPNLAFGQMLQSIVNNRVASAPSALPTVLQRRNASTIHTNSTGTTNNSCPTQAYCWFAPNGAQAGNTLYGAVQYSSGTSISTVTNDTSDTCAVAATATNATDSQSVSIWYCQNVTAGARRVAFTFSGATSRVSALGAESNNIVTSSPIDTTSTNTGSSTSLTAGSTTPSSSGYWLCQAAARTQTPKPTSFGVGTGQAYTVGSQSNITWNFVSTDAVDGLAMQCGQYNSTSAITPTFTTSSSTRFASVAAVFKTVTQGSARPSGIYIAGICEANEPTGPATIHLQCVTDGNLRVNSHGFGGTNYTTSSFSDSQSSSYTHSTIGQLGDGNSGKSDMYWVTNTSGSNAFLQDITTSGTASDYTLMIYDIVGAATSPFVQEAGAFRSTNPTPPITIYENLGTGNTDGITIFNLQEAQNTCQSVTSPSGGLSDATLFGGEDISGGGTHPPSENNCWLHSRNTDGTTQQTWTPGWADSTTLGDIAFHFAWFASSTATTTGNTAAAMVITCNGHANGAFPTNEWADESPASGFHFIYSSNVCKPASGTTAGTTHDAGNSYQAVDLGINQWAEITLDTVSGGTASGGQGIGVNMRYSKTAQTGYRFVVNAAASNQIQMGSMSAGTFTAFKTCSASTTPTAGDVFRFEVNGTSGSATQKVFQNGTQITGCNSTNTTVSTGGSVGPTFSSSMTTAGFRVLKAGRL